MINPDFIMKQVIFMLSLDELAHAVNEKIKARFQDRAIPSEKVSQNFMHQIVTTILKELRKEGEIPFIPKFTVLNKTSLEDSFPQGVPNFANHVNLFGLNKEDSPDKVGVMNVAIESDDARKYHDLYENKDLQTPASSPEKANGTPDGNPDPRRARKNRQHLTIIEGGKS